MVAHKHPFAAGVLTGCLEATINYPMEYTKAQLQLTKGVYTSPLDVVRKTLRNSGAVGMYRGLSTFIVFAPAAVAVRFSSFDAAQRQIESSFPAALDDQAQDFVCGLVSGMTEAIRSYLCPWKPSQSR